MFAVLTRKSISQLKNWQPLRLAYTISSSTNDSVGTKIGASQILINAKESSSLTFKELSEILNVNKVWLVSAMLGQHPIDADLTGKIIKTLNITGTKKELSQLIKSLGKIPESRGKVGHDKDPIVSRLDELVSVYGDTIKALIREEAGDGIMSAIDCVLNVEKKTIVKTNEKHASQEEVRIVITIDGKYLQYKAK